MGRADDMDTQGLHLMRLDKGVHHLLGKPPGPHSTALVHDSELDDGHCTISTGYQPTAAATSLAVPVLPSLSKIPIPFEEEAYLT